MKKATKKQRKPPPWWTNFVETYRKESKKVKVEGYSLAKVPRRALLAIICNERALAKDNRRDMLISYDFRLAEIIGTLRASAEALGQLRNTLADERDHKKPKE